MRPRARLWHIPGGRRFVSHSCGCPAQEGRQVEVRDFERAEGFEDVLEQAAAASDGPHERPEALSTCI